MILLTGNTGNLGQDIVKNLLKIRPELSKERAAASESESKKMQEVTVAGVTIKQLDFLDYEKLLEICDGVDKVLIISTNDQSQVPAAQQGVVIKAAQESGVKRIDYTSVMSA